MTTPTPIWQLQLTGDSSDLEHLSENLSSGSLRVLKDLQGYVLESQNFASCNSSEQVLEKSREHLAILSGILMAARQAPRALGAGAVILKNTDGSGQIFMSFHEELHARDFVDAVVIDSQGIKVAPPRHVARSVVLLQLALSDPAVAKVLRLLASPDRRTWVGLYRLHEVILEEIGGEKQLERLGWGSKTDLRRFKHSANSVAVAGDSARHGTEQSDAPKNPMTLDEADAYCGYVLQAWLTSKGA